MSEPMLYRIDLGVFEGFEGQWVDIHYRRNFGAYIDALEAQLRGAREYCLVRFARYVAAWSFDGSPADAKTVDALDSDVCVYILEQSEIHYGEVRRSPEARKSDAGTISSITRAS